MTRRSKRLKDIDKKLVPAKVYSLEQALEVLKGSPGVKFDQSVEVALRLGVDPRKSDQNVRGTVALPHGTGKTMRIVALARGDKVKEALEAGAEYAGNEDLLEKINGGWTDFDAVVATPDMMREVGKLGKVLGPRGLMPTPKAGTVTTDLVKAIGELKGGKIEFKLDRHGVINSAVGKLSFEADKLVRNITSFLTAVARAKPSGAKGQYMRSLYLSSTMGPGLKIELKDLDVV
jgi:large subunit ribosomal protein L1